jgi:O-methyltransferase
MSQQLAISLFPEWSSDLSPTARLANKLLRRLRLSLRVERIVDGRVDMTTLEQRLALVHLLADALHSGIPGDIIECGCFEGKTAALLTRVAHAIDAMRVVHVYDSFQAGFFLGGNVDIEQRLRANFASAGALLPWIHRGFFEQTIPAELPERICFAHLDAGTGGDPAIHRGAALHCLRHLYPRLAPGGVCVLMDCNDGTFRPPEDGTLAVRQAAQEFLADKPERLLPLYAGQATLAYFRRDFVGTARPVSQPGSESPATPARTENTSSTQQG